MLNPFSTIEHHAGRLLRLQTRSVYAMQIAVEILRFLDDEIGAEVKNTGWKQGFGLKVGTSVPIRVSDIEAELETDGNEIVIRQVSGTAQSFDKLCDLISKKEFQNA